MSPLRRALILGVSALGVAGLVALGMTAVGTTTAVAPSSTDTGVVSCRTDASGYCTVSHELGKVPVSAVLTPVYYPGTKPYGLATAKNGFTASTLRVRAVYQGGGAVASAGIEFSYVVHAGPNVPPTTTTTAAPTTTTAPPTTSPPDPQPTEWAVCGTPELDGPEQAPAGAVVVPAGNNSSVDFGRAVTYWFAGGVHTLGTGQFDQIQPASSATFTGAPGAVLDGQQRNAYAFVGHATNVAIRHLTVRNFVAPNNEGVVNHDSGQGWLMEKLTIQNNRGAAVMLGSGNTLRLSCLKDNGQYGFNSYHPTQGALGNITLQGNEIVGNNRDDWETRNPGCGCTGGGKFWDAHTVRVSGNWIHHNLSVGLWADQGNYDFVIENNLIEGNTSYGIFYETSYNAVIRNNVLRGNAVQEGQGRQNSGDDFPVGQIYLSEAGYDSRVPAPNGATDLRVEGNTFENGWGGVIAWENADRFCNSPANTSTGYCTLVGGTTTANCTAPGINTEPLYSDCRWKTQNVRVVNNTYKARGDCQVGFCNVNAVLSNYGSYPSWSPYKGTKIQQAITFQQNNSWQANTYTGAWRWVAFEPGRTLTLTEWQAEPYSQDHSSTLD